jgi:hypothetical protein
LVDSGILRITGQKVVNRRLCMGQSHSAGYRISASQRRSYMGISHSGYRFSAGQRRSCMGISLSHYRFSVNQRRSCMGLSQSHSDYRNSVSQRDWFMGLSSSKPDHRFTASQRRWFMGHYPSQFDRYVGSQRRSFKELSSSRLDRFAGSQRRSYMGLSASKGSRWDASQRSLNSEDDNWYQNIMRSLNVSPASLIMVLLAITILVLGLICVSQYRRRRHAKVCEGRVYRKSELDVEMQGNGVT